jgi:hypothetical protein
MAFVAVPLVACVGGECSGASTRIKVSLSRQVAVVARRAAASVAAAALLASSTTYATLATGLDSAGRLDKCRGDEACISPSSVGNPSKFGPPWTFEPQTSDVLAAWAALKESVLANKDKGTIVEASDGPSSFYLRAEFPSSFGRGTEYVPIRYFCACGRSLSSTGLPN